MKNFIILLVVCVILVAAVLMVQKSKPRPVNAKHIKAQTK